MYCDRYQRGTDGRTTGTTQDHATMRGRTMSQERNTSPDADKPGLEDSAAHKPMPEARSDDRAGGRGEGLHGGVLVTDELTARRLFVLSPIDKDGFCTGCNRKPTRETGRCLCIGGVATRVLPEATLAADTPDPRPCHYCGWKAGHNAGCVSPDNPRPVSPWRDMTPDEWDAASASARPVTPPSELTVAPLTAEEEAALRQLARTKSDKWRPHVHSLRRLFATLDAARAAPQADEGLRKLFAPYFEHHPTPDEDNEWCMKHLPHVEEVRAALAASSPATAGLDDRAEGDLNIALALDPDLYLGSPPLESRPRETP